MHTVMLGYFHSVARLFVDNEHGDLSTIFTWIEKLFCFKAIRVKESSGLRKMLLCPVATSSCKSLGGNVNELNV